MAKGHAVTNVRQHLLDNSKQMPSGCREWQLRGDKNGYGCVTIHRVTQRAHRAAYEAFIGPIPKGIWVLHRCDNPACINPEHLFLGTAADNSHDRDEKGHNAGGPHRGKTHCAQGHEFTPENTFFRNGRKWRGCRICRNASIRALYWRQKHRVSTAA